MCCDFAPDPRSKGFAGRLAALRAARPALERAAASHLLDLYRRQRKLPAGPLAALVGRRTRARIVAQGEIEATLGLNAIIPRLRDAARRLAARALLNNNVLEPFVGTFHDLVLERGRVRRVFVTVDSRPTRRAIQAYMPLEVFDASTTDVTAIVTHHHKQPTGHACLSCIYPHIPLEDARERDVADLLGLTLEQVKRRIVDADTAAALARKFGEPVEEFLGKSMDSLAKARCGSGPVNTAGGRQALAPFAFVSNLAGCLMVVDLLRSQSTDSSPANYVHLDPWRPPTPVRRLKPRRQGCEFCGDKELNSVLASLWGFPPP